MTIATTSQTRPQRSQAGAFKPLVPWILGAAMICALPGLFPSASALTILNQMAITIVFALSYNMLLGQGGMLSFGHAVYMGIGGFFAIHALNFVADTGFWLPVPLLPLVGGVAGLVFAAVIGLFSTRRAGTAFAMISLGVGELIAASSIILVVFFGGEEGISGDRTLAPAMFGLDFAPQLQVYGLSAAWMFLSALAMFLFSRTPIGRITNAVRDNEERAEFLGYSQRHVRMISFCLSGFFAGIAGALFAITFEIVTEENLNLALSGSILLITFLGGVGFFVGPIIGAVVFTLLQTVLGLYTEIWSLYLGLLFVASVLYFPDGLAGVLAMHHRPWRLGRIGLLVRPYLLMAVPAGLTVLSLAALLEILFHQRSVYSMDHHMTLFGLTFDSSGMVPPIVAGGLALLSFAIAVRLAPGLKSAWERANHTEEAR